MLRDLQRTAGVLRETGSAKNFEDITEQDWPDGDLNPTAEGVEPSQETRNSQLPSDRRRLVRKTLPSRVDGTHPDPRNEHFVQTPADAPSQHELPTSMEQLDVRQPTVELETTTFCQCYNQCRNRHNLARLRNHVQNSHESESECIHHHCQCQFRPLPFHNTSPRRFKQVGESVEDPEEEEEEMMLVTTVAPGPRSESCLLAGARREIHPSSPEWSTPTGRELIAQEVKIETDMLICDKRALVPLSLEVCSRSQGENCSLSNGFGGKCDDEGNRFAKARLTARSDQDPELLSLVRNQQTSAPTVSTNGKVVALQVIASSVADVELGDVTGAFLESAELSRQGGKHFLRQPSGGLPGLHPQQLLEIRLPLYGLNDSPKRWFLEVSNVLRNIGWKSSALDECVFMFFDPDSKVLGRILCLHVDDLLLGGCGTAYRQTVDAPRPRFPLRKWKRNQGELCGSRISQDVLTKEITVSQSTYALKINKVTVRVRAQPEDKATTAEVRSLRDCNGAVQWLAKESRPDLAVQVSLSQQALSDPRVRHCRQANVMVRRATCGW